MSKIIAIGDIHGRTIWEEIVKNNSFDKCIFIGDYFDSYYRVSSKEQIVNFLNICSFTKNNKSKVTMLTGNHDFQYLKRAHPDDKFNTGYQFAAADQIQVILEQEIELLQMCKVIDTYLFTHAGVTETWCAINGIDKNNLAESINESFNTKPSRFYFKSGRNRSASGNDVTQSPIWVRPPSLGEDFIEGYRQVVGHTTQKDGIKLKAAPYILIDALGVNEYLVIEDGKPRAEKI